MENPSHHYFKPGVVIPAIESRIENTTLVVEKVLEQSFKPNHTVIVCDGFVASHKTFSIPEDQITNVSIVNIEKHHPGREQPRNVGVRWLSTFSDSNYVWFLDSDCYPDKKTLEEYRNAFNVAPSIDKIMIGPYDWMNQGRRSPDPHLRNDPRWPMFEEHSTKVLFRGNLGVAMGCFSGNLVWPIKEFKRVGGFWNELHMGRCEDGELGIRACAMQVPMVLVKDARAWHMKHEVNSSLVQKKNKRDVPMINARHPYVQDEGLIVVDYDGKRFDVYCQECDSYINTINSWKHFASCHKSE